MKFRKTRLLIGFLFLLWIGGMVVFVSNNHNRELPRMPEDERRKHIEQGKRSRELDRHNHPEESSIKDNPKAPPKAPPNPVKKDARSLSDFDWKEYIRKSGLKPGEDKNQRNAYNQQASDSLPWDRQVPDVRDQKCQNVRYDGDLPTTSIIICFHNEGRAALLRTIISALNRSPDHLLVEIILVDDFSKDPSDGEELLKLPKTKLIRNNKREGLIRSRVKGADIAKGDVLTFLDSHCESNKMWLEPLLQSIKNNRKIVVSPIIDVINHDDFNYLSSSSDLRGGFGWNLNFKWDFLPPDALAKHQQDGTAHIKSPAIAGGLFSIDKTWFAELGKYDPEMDVWGGENLEISFRTWQCGGELHIVPCSRVGHVFRERHPYNFPGGSMNVFQKNTRRAAEVWMDEYKKFYFAAVPSARYAAFGDIRERLHLRSNLQCKSFKWFLENVYPELKVPDDDDIKYGELRQGQNCLDTLGHKEGQSAGTFACHGQGGNQHWSWTKKNQLKHETVCLTARNDNFGSALDMIACNKDNMMQKWNYIESDSKLVNMKTKLCLDSFIIGKDVTQRTCSDSDSQKWKFHMENS